MNLLKTALIPVLGLMIVCTSVQAGEEQPGQNELGEKLIRELWATSAKADLPALEKMLAKGFQSVHADGARDREQEIKLLKKLQLKKYKLSEIKATRNGPVIVVSYFVSAEEIEEGKQLPKKASARLTVFLKTDSGWKWMAHAHLEPLKK
jgi:hypothetical protein